ncbi:MAG TPA: hypothetical protein VKG21_20295 [Casimicrobiaceae bacterium]|nr:hypothetical protein [Casimicrobiaceae bacterium]
MSSRRDQNRPEESDVVPETLLPSTLRWIAALPLDVQPATIVKTLPTVANKLSLLWATPEAFRAYVQRLLVGKRKGLQHFPIKVSRELRALRAYRDSLRRDDDDAAV